MSDEFYIQWGDGNERIIIADSFDDAAEIAHRIGPIATMDYADCLWPSYYASIIAQGKVGLRGLFE